MKSLMQGWAIECPDKIERHCSYINYGDAKCDADLLSSGRIECVYADESQRDPPESSYDLAKRVWAEPWRGKYQVPGGEPPMPDASPEAAQAALSDPPPPESSYDLAKRVWAELWRGKYQVPYAFSPNLGPKSEHSTLRWLGDRAKERGGADAERWIRHWVSAYLRDHGKHGSLDEQCHPVRWIESAVNSAGEPKSPRPKRAKVPEQEPPPLHVDPWKASESFRKAFAAGQISGKTTNTVGAK